MERILLIASSSLLANKVLATIAKRDDVSLTVLVPTDKMIAKLHLNDKTKVVSVPGAKGFSFRAVLPYLFANKSKRQRFDTVICLYNNKTGYGYLNVDLFALTTKADHKFAYNYDQEEIKLTARYFFNKIVCYVAGWFWLIVNSFFLIIIFVLIFIVMCAVELGIFFSEITTKKEVSLQQ